MRIRWRFGVLVFAILAMAGAGTAPCAFACTCLQQTLAEAAEAGAVVVVGRVGERVGDRHPFVVERWFAGSRPTQVLILPVVDPMLDCGGRSFASGDHVILVGELRGDVLTTGPCSPSPDVNSLDGRQLLAEAGRLFGQGLAPEAPEPPGSLPPGPPGSGLLPVALLGAAGVGLLALGIGSVVLLARQRRRAD